MEVKIKVLSYDSISKGSVLWEYVEFVRTLKRNRLKCGADAEKAITETVKECMAKGILCEFLETVKGEIVEMLVEEMQIEDFIGTAEENWKYGFEDGMEKGMEKGIRNAIKLHKQLGHSENEALNQISEGFEMKESEVAKLIRKYW